MTDKEVGELWRKYSPWSGLNGIELEAAKDVCEVIRKLVEERASHLFSIMDGRYRSSHERDRGICFKQALCDLGIDDEAAALLARYQQTRQGGQS